MTQKWSMFDMETWKERFPMESMLPDDLIGRYNKEGTAAFRVADPYNTAQFELGQLAPSANSPAVVSGRQTRCPCPFRAAAVTPTANS
jgi:hypothetical protein